jgi:hypothetical protein
MLSVMKRLQCLRLRSCTLLPYCPEWEDAAAADAAASAAMSAFLAAVGGMTDLVSLVIQDDGFCYETRGWEAAPAAAFRALTASSKLQELVVQADNELPLPWGAVQHVFPAGRVLPHLTKLELEGIPLADNPIKSRQGSLGFMSAQDLEAVVAACPALKKLGLCNALESGAGLQALQQLPSTLTSLSVGGCGDSVAALVAQLTGLKALFWASSPDLTDAGLQHLTALRRLTQLHMYSPPLG